MAHHEKVDAWREFILNCQKSGMTTRQFCDDNDVNVHTYYYWMKKLREKACVIPKKKLVPQVNPPQAIVPIIFHNEENNLLKADQSTTAVILHLNSITMEIRNGASESIIRNTIQALKLCYEIFLVWAKFISFVGQRICVSQWMDLLALFRGASALIRFLIVFSCFAATRRID